MGIRIKIMLIGKTGHGKSATGNTLVGQNRIVFEVSDNSTSATSSVSSYTYEHDQMTVTVVDTPGMQDTRDDDNDQDSTKAVSYMHKAFGVNQDGIDLFLLVLPYGARHTKDEADAVSAFVNTYYGSELLKRCTILFTHGDNFKVNHPKSEFKDWCDRQEGALGELLQAVRGSYVLLDNTRDSPEQKDKVRQIILDIARQNQEKFKSMSKDVIEKMIKHIQEYIKRRVAHVLTSYCPII